MFNSRLTMPRGPLLCSGGHLSKPSCVGPLVISGSCYKCTVDLLRYLRCFLRWVGAHELGSIIAVFVLAFGSLVFVRLADEVGEHGVGHMDRLLLLALREPHNLAQPIGPVWLVQVERDITAMGGLTVMTLLCIAVIGHLLLAGLPRAALVVGVSVGGALGLSQALKHVFGRERPTVVPHLVEVSTASFPSGHSMVAAAVYLTLGALLARMQSRFVQKAYLLIWGGLLTGLVGMSRVYLGVHYPTDVLAGWAAGAGWASLCWLAARGLQRRGELERPLANHSDSV